MGKVHVSVTNLNVGILSKTLFGRADLKKYMSGVAEAKNIDILTHGGLKRRGGLRYISEVPKGSRPFAFEFNIQQTYIVLFTPSNILIYKPKDSNLYADIVLADKGVTDFTEKQLLEMDIIQSADTIIITHEDFHPIMVQRQGSDTSWDVKNLPLTNIPKFDFDHTKKPSFFNYGDDRLVDVALGEIVYNTDGNAIKGINNHLYKAKKDLENIHLDTEDYTNTANWEDLGVRPDVWGDTGGAYVNRGYPRTCTFHQGRLWFGGSKSKPTSVWGSATNDYFNFDTGTNDVLDDDAIFDVLDTDQFNAITNIISGANLEVLTSGGEFVNNAKVLTPKTSAWLRYTTYGASRIKPVTLDGSTYYVDRFGKTIRGLVYNLKADGYLAPQMSLLAEHLLNNIRDLGISRGSQTSVANTVYVVNGDGTVALFNTMIEEDIKGWTWYDTPNGLFKHVVVNYDTVSFIVERSNGKQYLEVLDADILVDHAFTNVNDNKVIIDNFLHDKNIVIVGDNIVQENHKIVQDGTNYEIFSDRPHTKLYAGLNYDVIIRTLPVIIEVKDNDGTSSSIAPKRKRVSKCSLLLDQSRGVYVNNNLVTTKSITHPLNTPFKLVDGYVSVYLLGY